MPAPRRRKGPRTASHPASPAPPRRQSEGKEAVFQRLFWAGDVVHGASTVVEAAAYGKRVANTIHEFLQAPSEPQRAVRVPPGDSEARCQSKASPYQRLPVSLETDFFGVFRLRSPFLLSASPLTDGLEPVRRAYEAGWPGVVMKTAFK